MGFATRAGSRWGFVVVTTRGAVGVGTGFDGATLAPSATTGSLARCPSGRVINSAVGGITAFGAASSAAIWVGWNPQSCLRLRVTRGIHVTFPSIPARINTQPRLSTYCLPEKDAGGNSAGVAASRADWAAAEPAPNAANPAAASNALAIILVSIIRRPHNIWRQDARKRILSKADALGIYERSQWDPARCRTRARIQCDGSLPDAPSQKKAPRSRSARNIKC